MIRTVSLENKPLCLIKNNGKAYIGDARGNVYEILAPFTKISCLLSLPGPVSAICFFNDKITCGTWDGIIYYDKKVLKLGKNQIKAMCVYKDALFVSVDKSLVILDVDFNIIKRYEVKNKIFCIEPREDGVYLGYDCGLVGSYSNDSLTEPKALHSSTVLCIKDGFTGSCDGTIRKNDAIIFQGDSWIKSIVDQGTFCCGNRVISNNEQIYTHEDEITGILKVGNTIISIGLDYCYKIYQKGIIIDEEEEKELLSMLNS